MQDTNARLRLGIGNALLALAVLAPAAAPATAQQDMSNLMRQKLDRAQGLFEAVVLARFPGRRALRGRSASHQRTVHLVAAGDAVVPSLRGGVPGSRAEPRPGGRRARHRRGIDRVHDADLHLRAMPPDAARIPAGRAQPRSGPPCRPAAAALVRCVFPGNDRTRYRGAAADGKAHGADTPPAMSKATILIADDERLIRWSLVERLSGEGYGTIEAESGRQTLARFDDAVDLVLLDYRLGDTDGLHVLEALRRRDADVLVIVLTAYSDVETAVAVMKQGAYHYVTKPFNLDEIALLVGKALETTPAAAGVAGHPRETAGAVQSRPHHRRLRRRSPRSRSCSARSRRAPPRPCSSPGRAAPGRTWPRR